MLAGYHAWSGILLDDIGQRVRIIVSGIVGVVGRGPVNQVIYDSLILLQHRGQDAAGIVTTQEAWLNVQKGRGLVRDVFQTRNMCLLPGNAGIGHTTYQTATSDTRIEALQPSRVDAPFVIALGYNGNVNNWRELRQSLFREPGSYSESDSESGILLDVLADELQTEISGTAISENSVFSAVHALHARTTGSYAAVAMIAGYGLLAFRDPHGIRPLCLGRRDEGFGEEWMVASESVALASNGFTFVRDLLPGEAVLVNLDGGMSSCAYGGTRARTPCAFEYVYLARPDSFMDGVSIYGARLRMGEHLATKVARQLHPGDIDVVMPVPDSARPAAMQLANQLNLDYREGLNKSQYVGRTFIMPDQEARRRSVRQKLTTINMEFKGKSVLLVDDSIVRGTTSREIVAMARAAGARRIYMASAAPPVRYQNVYGIDMPAQVELIAYDRSEDEVARCIGVDALIYQDLEALRASVASINPAITELEDSCFSGRYVTGDG
ncbi:amidophosphoribosyltransferase [Luteimonas sp. A277]